MRGQRKGPSHEILNLFLGYDFMLYAGIIVLSILTFYAVININRMTIGKFFQTFFLLILFWGVFFLTLKSDENESITSYIFIGEMITMTMYIYFKVRFIDKALCFIFFSKLSLNIYQYDFQAYLPLLLEYLGQQSFHLRLPLQGLCL